MPPTKKRNKSFVQKDHPYDEAKVAKEEAEERALSALLFTGVNTKAIVPAYDEDYSSDNEIASSASIDEDKVQKQDDAVWVDEDDINLSVDISKKNRLRKLRKSEAEDEQVLDSNEFNKRLRSRFQNSHFAVSTEWANTSIDDGAIVEAERDDPESDDDISVSFDGILQDTASVLGSSLDLPPNIIEMKRCKDANAVEPSSTTIQSVNFHSSGEVVLTAGFDQMLRFFRVDGEENPKITGIRIKKFPIHSASFLGNTGKVVLGSRRPYYCIFDSVAGKLEKVDRILGRREKSLEKLVTSPDGRQIAFTGNDGYIIVVDSYHKQRIGCVKMNGSTRSISFSDDSNYIFGTGTDGDVYK